MRSTIRSIGDDEIWNPQNPQIFACLLLVIIDLRNVGQADGLEKFSPLLDPIININLNINLEDLCEDLCIRA